MLTKSPSITSPRPSAGDFAAVNPDKEVLASLWPAIDGPKGQLPSDSNLAQFLSALVSSTSSDAGVLLLDRFENTTAICKRIGHITELKLRDSISSDASGMTASAFFCADLGISLLLSVEGLSKTRFRNKLGKRIIPTLVTILSSLLTTPPLPGDDSSSVSPHTHSTDALSSHRILSVMSPRDNLFASLEEALKEGTQELRRPEDLRLACRLSAKILDALANLSKDNFALRELVITTRLQSIVSLLPAVELKIALPVGTDSGVNYVQALLFRLLSMIVREVAQNSGGTGREEKWIQILSKHGLVSSLLRVLSSQSIPPSLQLDALSLLVYSIEVSTPFSFLLANDFVNLSGYSTLTAFLVDCSSRSQRWEQAACILASGRLVFVDMTMTKRVGIPNIAAVQMLLRVLDKSPSYDTRSLVLASIRDIYQYSNRDDRKVIIFELNLFDSLFSSLRSFTMADREIISKLIELAIDDSLFSLTVKRYCQLLFDANLSTLISVSSHLTILLQKSKLSRSVLREIGFVSILLEFLKSPATYSSLKDRLEFDTCSALLGQKSLTGVTIASLIEGGTRQVLLLTATYLADNAPDQAAFIRGGGVSLVAERLESLEFRSLALALLVVISSGDVLQESKVVEAILVYLKRVVPLDDIAYRCEVIRDCLVGLGMIMQANQSMIGAFGEAGGFPWISAVLSSMTSQLRPLDERAWIILQSIIEVVSAALSSAAAQVRFRAEVGLKRVVSTFEALGFVSDERYTQLSIAQLTRLGLNKFPLACSVHLQQSLFSSLQGYSFLPNASEKYGTNPYLVSLERLKCEQCVADMFIKYPPVFKHLVKIFGRHCALLDQSESGQQISSESFMSHRSFIVAFKTLCFPFDSASNMKILSQLHMIQQIAEAFKDTFLNDSLSEHGAVRRNLALGFIVRIARYSISLEEFKSFISLLHRDSYPAVLTETMVALFTKDQAPSRFLSFPKRRNALNVFCATVPRVLSYLSRDFNGIRSSELSFPRFSVVDSLAAKSRLLGRSLVLPRERQLRQTVIQSPQSTAKIAFGIDNGIFYVKSMRHFEVSFDSFKIVPGKWYHIVLSHSCINPPSMTKLSLYVNGVRIETLPLMYPIGELSQVSCNFGSGQPNKSKSPELIQKKKNSAAEWYLGNVFVFETSLRDDEAFLVYYLGPDYVGNLDVKMDQVKVYDHANEDEIQSHMKQLDILDPAVNKISLFQERIVCALSSRSLGYAKFEQKARGLVEYSAELLGNVFAENRTSGKDILPYMGGMGVLVYLFVTAKSTNHRVHALNSIHNALEWSSTNVSDMLSCGGYGIIARAMRKDNCDLNEPILEAVFKLCGLRKSALTSTYSLGVIKNLPVFEHLVLDWYIWNRSPKDIRRLLLSSIADMLDPNNQTAFYNVGRLRQANCRPILFRLLQEPDIGFKSASIITDLILPRVLRSPWDEADIEDVFQFVIASHSPEQSQLREFPSRMLSSPLSLDSYRTPSKAQSKKLALPKAEKIRNLILKMVTDYLVGPNGNTTAPLFFQHCTLRVLLLLAQTEAESTRIYVISLLAKYLSYASNLKDFIDYSGFYALGVILKGLPIADGSISALFCLMFGVPGRSDFLSTYFSATRRFVDTDLRYPECVVSILLSVSNSNLSRTLKHHALRVLHDIFLHLQSGKLLLIRNDAIELLCSLLVSEFENKATDKGLNADDQTDQWVIEEDVMAFLRAICLYNCDLTMDANSLRFILLAIQSLELPRDYAVVLQYRLLYDVLSFYQESSVVDTRLLVLFERILILSIVHCEYLDDSQRLNPPVAPPLSASSSKLSPSSSSIIPPAEATPNISSPRLRSTTNRLKKSVDLTTVNWKSNTNLLFKERALVRLIFAIATNMALGEKESSLLGKINKGLQRARQGVDQNFKWHFERFVYQMISSAASDPFIVSFIFTTLADMDLALVTNNEYEFVARCFHFSKIFLNSADADVATAARTFWKVVLLKGKSYLNKIIYHPPVGSASIASDVFKIILVDTLPKQVAEWESKEKKMTEKSQSEYSAAITSSKTESSKRTSVLRDLKDKITEHTLGLYQTMMKPLYSHVRNVLQREHSAKRHWKKLLKRISHQRACFPIHPSLIIWELDPTEGPMRTRLRLEPLLAHAHPIVQLLSQVAEAESSSPSKDLKMSKSNRAGASEIYRPIVDVVELRKLESLFGIFDGPDSSDFVEEPPKLDILQDESIQHVLDVTNVTPFHNRDGNMLVGEFQLYFVDEHQFENEADQVRKITSVRRNLCWPYEEIREVYKRRILLKDTGMEIFMMNGKTSLIGFQNTKDRNLVYDYIMKLDLPHLVRDEAGFFTFTASKESMTSRWQKGLVTNYEYLMHLNTLAGRTYNDLTQYPIFPFLIADYDSEELSLSEPAVFRDLTKPMGAQDEGRLMKFLEKYSVLESMGETPYHYGSHYSTIGGVLHFLARMEPFARYLIEFQGGKFDVADRMFQSIKTTWDQSSRVSTSDVKELTPEFFSIPDFLVNRHRFDLGTKQNGEKVADIKLPVWAHGSPEKFIELHREALESDHVSAVLHEWIDLIFGFKQTGPEAVEAKNVFYPLTYEGAVDVDKITDPVQKLATITQISNFGQIPRKLFSKPHPQRILAELPSRASLGNEFEAIMSSSIPGIAGPVGFIGFVQNKVVPLKAFRTLLWSQGEKKSTAKVVQFGSWDGSIRFLSGKENKLDRTLDLPALHLDETTCVDVSRDGTIIATGARSSAIRIWKRKPRYLKTFKRQVELKLNQRIAHARSNSEIAASAPNAPKIDRPKITRNISQQDIEKRVAEAVKKNKVDVSYAGTLNGHNGQITCIKASSEFSIIVSGSADRSCIIYDANRTRFVRSLDSHNGQIVALDIHPYTGDIVVIDDPANGYGTIHLWTINGDKRCTHRCNPRATSVAFSRVKPGTSKDVVITGHINGEINLWSIPTLKLLRTIRSAHSAPVTALAVNEDNISFASGDWSGNCCLHEIRQNL